MNNRQFFIFLLKLIKLHRLPIPEASFKIITAEGGVGGVNNSTDKSNNNKNGVI